MAPISQQAQTTCAVNQSELKTSTRDLHQARENANDQVVIGCGLIWLAESVGGASFFNQSQSEIKPQQLRATIHPLQQLRVVQSVVLFVP